LRHIPAIWQATWSYLFLKSWLSRADLARHAWQAAGATLAKDENFADEFVSALANPDSLPFPESKNRPPGRV
jgi:hypothetical protein